MSKNVVFLLFRQLKWPISRERLNRFSIYFFQNAQKLILNRLNVIKFSISLIVFSQNAKNWFEDLATMKLAILQNFDVMAKFGFRIQNQRPKIIRNELVSYQYRKKSFILLTCVIKTQSSALGFPHRFFPDTRFAFFVANKFV